MYNIKGTQFSISIYYQLKISITTGVRLGHMKNAIVGVLTI